MVSIQLEKQGGSHKAHTLIPVNKGMILNDAEGIGSCKPWYVCTRLVGENVSGPGKCGFQRGGVA